MSRGSERGNSHAHFIHTLKPKYEFCSVAALVKSRSHIVKHIVAVDSLLHAGLKRTCLTNLYAYKFVKYVSSQHATVGLPREQNNRTCILAHNSTVFKIVSPSDSEVIM